MLKRPGLFRNKRELLYAITIYIGGGIAILALVWFAIACFAAVMS